MNRKNSAEIVTINPSASDKMQKGISRGSRNAENKADAWEKVQIAKIRKRYAFVACFVARYVVIRNILRRNILKFQTWRTTFFTYCLGERKEDDGETANGKEKGTYSPSF